MRWQIVKSLIRLNLIYSADARTIEKLRKEQIKNPNMNLPLKIVRTQLIIGVIFAVVLGLMLAFLDIEKEPETFGIYGFFFSLVTFLQSFLIVFNVFYESKDMEGYKSIPVTMTEVVLGKSVTVVLGVLFYLLPLILIFFVMPFKVAPNFLLAVVFTFLNIILIPISVLILSFVSVNLIGATEIFQKHKKAVSTALTGIVSLILAVSFLALNPDIFVYALLKNNEVLFKPFIQLMYFEMNPTIFAGIISIGPWIVTITLCIIYTKKVILANLYNQTSGNISGKNRTKIIRDKSKKSYQDELKCSADILALHIKERKEVGFKRLLFKYNLGLLEDTTVLFQFLITPQIIMPLIMAGSLSQLGKYTENIVIDGKFSIVAIVIGIFYAFMTSGTLHFIMISLDRENFNFIKSLPMDFSKYIMYKFWFAFIIQSIIPTLFIFGICIWLGVPIYMIFEVILAFLMTSLFLCHRSFNSDYEYLDVNWQSVTQLLNRDGGNVKRAFLFFVSIFVGVICTVVSAYLSTVMPYEIVIISASWFLIVLALLIFSYHRMRVRYWKTQG